jgi:hypothetical protein
METTLTIPKNRIVPSLAVAGLGSLACASSPQDMLASLLENGSRSTGSNVTWLESALPDFSPEHGQDLYVLTIQRLKSLNTKAQDAVIARSDRDSLLEIKDVLSLTGAQLATALGASRTALYHWIEESKAMRPKYRAKLQNLRRLSDQWSEKVGTPLARSPWVCGAQRAQLVEMLTSKSESSLVEAQRFLEQLALLKPGLKTGHRSILEIVKENDWKKLPEHVREAQWNSRRPSARITSDPS